MPANNAYPPTKHPLCRPAISEDLKRSRSSARAWQALNWRGGGLTCSILFVHVQQLWNHMETWTTWIHIKLRFFWASSGSSSAENQRLGNGCAEPSGQQDINSRCAFLSWAKLKFHQISAMWVRSCVVSLKYVEILLKPCLRCFKIFQKSELGTRSTKFRESHFKLPVSSHEVDLKVPPTKETVKKRLSIYKGWDFYSASMVFFHLCPL